MPAVHFEYTGNLAIDNHLSPFLQDVHHTLVDIIKTDLLTCRSTITCHQHYVVGNGDAHNAFIQLSIRMLPGRSKETKDKLGRQLLTMINQVFATEITKNKIQVRVYLTEIDKDYYYGL